MQISSLLVSLFSLPLALCQSGSPSDVRLPPTIVTGPVLGDYYRSDAAFTLPCIAYGVPETSGITQVLTKVVTEGEPFCIKKQPIKSIPKEKSTWETASSIIDKNPITLRLSNRTQISENGDLCFAYAKIEDNLGGKIYKVTEFNDRIDLSAGGSYTNVSVTRVPGGPKQFAPTLLFSSVQQAVALEGQEVTLRCFFSGNPEPSIWWSGPKNTLPIGRYNIGTHRSWLTIRNVQPSDEGDYSCLGENSVSTNRHTLQIRVEALPRFTNIDDQPRDANVSEGATLTFRCYTYAKPEAVVVWLRNGQPLDLNNLPRRFRISADKKSLTIENLCRDCTDRPDSSQSDLTIIQCNASNIHGYAFAAGYVNVLLKTSVMFIGEKNVSVDMNLDKEFTWECKATSDPSTPPLVRWFRETNEGDQLVNEEPPALLLKNGTIKIHVVPNKTLGWEKYQGRYRCDAENGYTKQSVYASINIIQNGPTEPGNDRKQLNPMALILGLLLGASILIIIILSVMLHRRKRHQGQTYTAADAGHEYEIRQRAGEHNRKKGRLGNVATDSEAENYHAYETIKTEK